MIDLITTDAFAAWFSTLPPGPAEDVAAAIEVLVQLGTRAEAPGSSEALLWYEHPLLAQTHQAAWSSVTSLRDVESRFSPEFLKFYQDWGHFNGYVRRVIKHLESKPFLARLARLSSDDAAAVAAAVERIRKMATRRVLSVSDFQRRRSLSPFRAPNAFEARSLAGFVDTSAVREAYFEALAAAGFEVVDVPPRHSVLREITVRSTPPGIRLLYGIDEKRNRGLVVLGEWLDKTFYGHSVRQAEALWGRFVEESTSTRLAGVR